MSDRPIYTTAAVALTAAWLLSYVPGGPEAVWETIARTVEWCRCQQMALMRWLARCAKQLLDKTI